MPFTLQAIHYSKYAVVLDLCGITSSVQDANFALPNILLRLTGVL
ncbi:MAG: hypothetical protein NTY69_07665 [Methylococcales bacterium]|nr:hypothetical protein [Methylococcales bacterium]